MKKTLIALAAIAAVSSAMADVTISGYFDRGFIAKNSTDGTASTNTIGSAAGTTGLFFKGNEKLSSDLSGIFSIETDFADLGGASQTATVNYTNQAAGFANGEVFIGLQSAGLGSLKLGSPNFFMLGAVTSVGAPGFGTGIGSTFGASSFQIFNGISTGAGTATNTGGIATISTTPASTTANYGARDIRITNSVQLQSNDFGGLKFGLTFAPQNNNVTQTAASAGATANTGLGNTVGVTEYNLRYTNAASGIDATYDLIKYTVGSNGVETLIAGVNKAVPVLSTAAQPANINVVPTTIQTLVGNSTSTHSFVGATYTYNPSIKLHGGYGTSQSGDNVYQTRSTQLGATYTMGMWDLMAQSAQVTDAGTNAYTANRSITGLGANYNFSKMTRAYARYETVNYATNQTAFSGSVVTRTAVGVSASF